MGLRPTSVLFGIKSVNRRKQKNLFAILAIALGVSLIAGIAITGDSLSEGFGYFFTYSLGEKDGSIMYDLGFMDQSHAEIISSDALTHDGVIGVSHELTLSVTAINDAQGQISIGTPMIGIEEDEDENLFGYLKGEDGKVKVSDLGTSEVFIGKELADDLKLEKLGSFGYSFSLGNLTFDQILTVKDIIKVESRGQAFWGGAIIANLQHIQNLIGNQIAPLGLPTHPITQINLKFHENINNIDAADKLVDEMKDSVEILPITTAMGGITKFRISADRETIKVTADELSEALSQILTIFGSVIIFAGLLLISNIQLMSVEDRQQQTGIQRAIGTQGRQVIIANITEFMITGVVGGLFGIIGALIYSRLLIEAFGIAFGFSGSIIPVKIAPGVLILSFLVGFILALVTGLLPAIRASRINIVETLRGVENKAESIERGSGTWGLYIGIIMSLLGIILLAGLDVQPWDYPDAYRNINDTENIYFMTIFLMVGISLILSYFVSRDMALNISGFTLFIVPIIFIFWLLGAFAEGSGGINLFLGIMLSMIIGAIMLVGINLQKVADFAESIFSRLNSVVAMISFRQMASQKVRSTLTFAIFAVILTMNIFMASMAYSDRYGSIKLVESIGGGPDVLVKTDQPLNTTMTEAFLQGLLEFDEITFARAFALSGFTDTFLKPNGTITEEDGTEDDIFDINYFSLNNQSFWDENDETMFNMLIKPEKINISSFDFPIEYSKGFETDKNVYPDQMHKDSNSDENDALWKAVANNVHVRNKSDGRDFRPIIVPTVIGELDDMGVILPIKEIGDSVWLPTIHTDANNEIIYKEFIIAGVAGITAMQSNPLFDSADLLGGFLGPEEYKANAFINEEEARDLIAFNDRNISKLNQNNYFLIKGAEGIELNSKKNVDLAQDIEEWSNKLGTDSFREEYGLFGIIAISVYSLYEIFFDANFRFFAFIQTFVSFGFIVGVLGLLVVSVRSVQERKREIGMMRSIGLKRYEVTISIMMELSVMGIIGLIIGFFCGNILAYGMLLIFMGGKTEFLIPWFDPWLLPPIIPGGIAFYAILTISAAFVAAIIPGRSA
ncbi:MAG: ABC transporter permease, partial [Candidatus Hodarchaeales archaeon]